MHIDITYNRNFPPTHFLDGFFSRGKSANRKHTRNSKA